MDINLLKSHLNAVHDMSNTTQRNLVEEVEVEVAEDNKIVFDFFENYFGDNLNEDTTDDDIFNAIVELNELSSAVYEFATGDNAFASISMEYFASYFGGTLNEDTTDEDIENAVEQLLHTCHEVNEYFQIEESILGKIGRGAMVGGAAYLAYKNRARLGQMATDWAGDKITSAVKDKWDKMKGSSDKSKETMSNAPASKEPNKSKESKPNTPALHYMAKQLRTARERAGKTNRGNLPYAGRTPGGRTIDFKNKAIK